MYFVRLNIDERTLRDPRFEPRPNLEAFDGAGELGGAGDITLSTGLGTEGGGADIKPAYFRIHDSSSMDLNGQSADPENLPRLFSSLAAGEKALLAIWSGPDARVQDVVDVMSAARREGLNTVIVTGK